MRFIFTILCFCALALPAISEAQLVTPVTNITTSPRFPDANTTFTASINPAANGLFGATIVWSKNGVVQSSGVEQTVTFTTGNVGERMQISAVATGQSGRTLTYKTTVLPVGVDVVLESRTLTPTFYKGRAEPSYGSEVKAVAFINAGNSLSPTGLFYTWSLNGDIIGTPNARGKYATSFTMPSGQGTDLLLTVKDSGGNIIASKAFAVPVSEPELVFYQDNALRGIDDIAIQDNKTLLGEEITLRAEPYFMNANITSQNLHTEWKLNGRTVQSNNQNPRTLTLQKNATNGSFTINFHIRNLKALLQGVERSLRVRF